MICVFVSFEKLICLFLHIQPIPLGVTFSKAQSSKFERLFCHVSLKRDHRALSFELWNSIRKCHPKWDRLYMQEETYQLVKRDISTCQKICLFLHMYLSDVCARYSSNVSVNVYTHICVYAYVYVRIYRWVYLYLYIYQYIFNYIWMQSSCLQIRRFNFNFNFHSYTCVCICAWICVYIHIYMHIYIHTDTHIYI